MSKSVLAAMLLAAMAGAWYWALLPPPAAVQRTPVALGAGARLPPGPPSVHLDRLGRRAVPRVDAGGVGDPFRGRPHAPPPIGRTGASGAQMGPAVAAAAVEPSAPLWPRLDLIGVAEADDGGGRVRTAIVSGPQGVQHARPGDLLAQVYRVERIADDGVDVRLLPEDRLVRLALRR